jgi:pimeloyl-ACP methyl ester carboxylesterase
MPAADKRRSLDHVDQARRRFVGIAAMALVTIGLGGGTWADLRLNAGRTAGVPTSTAPGNPTFGTLKHIEAGVLDVGYIETGPADGPVVLLLHGWPYDVHTYAEVAPRLEAAGYRVIVPYLRGYGPTRFRSADAFRNGQQSALALDVVALMDALKIRQAIVGGVDWGARTANIVAALWPERCKGMVSVSGYLIGNRAAAGTPLLPEAEYQWWYQYYFATERGRAGYHKYRREFARLIWRLASPEWRFDEKTFQASAAALDNPDHVAIVVHNYRWRLGLAEGEPSYDQLERQLAVGPTITVPTITLEGDANGAPHPDASAYAGNFTGKYEHRVITPGIGHNLPQEAPGAFAQAIMDVDRMHRSHNPRGSHEHDRKP